MSTNFSPGSGHTPLGPVSLIAFSAIFAWGLSASYVLFETELFWMPTLALICSLSAPIAILRSLLDLAIRKTREAIANTPSTRHGSARWASLGDFARLRKHCHGPFWGALDGKPLFIEYEANALTVAPAGAGKTISVVVPQLLSIKGAMVVSDLKCELAPMTKRARERMGQPVYCLNPSGTNIDLLGEPDAYNPLCILHDDWTHSPADMEADAMGMAHQLHPEPATRLVSRAQLLAGRFALAVFALGVPVSKMAAMASRLTAASRSISSRTACVRSSTEGSDFVFSIHASSARRISSVTVRSFSWAMMSNCARVDSLNLTASVFTGP